jgi:hypothetical protein
MDGFFTGGAATARMFGHYARYFWMMMYCVFGLPSGSMFLAAIKRELWPLRLVCAVIIEGVRALFRLRLRTDKIQGLNQGL